MSATKSTDSTSSTLSSGVLKMSARRSTKTADKTSSVAQPIFQRVITVGGQRYRVWASTTEAGNRKSVGASVTEWQGVEKSLQTVLGEESVKKVKGEVTVALDGDALVVTGHGSGGKTHNKQSPVSSTQNGGLVSTFKKFQGNVTVADKYIPPGTSLSSYSTPKAVSSGSTKSVQSSSLLQPKKTVGSGGAAAVPLLSQKDLATSEAVNQLRDPKVAVDSNTFLTGLQHVQNQLGGSKASVAILAPDENLPNVTVQRKTAWEVVEIPERCIGKGQMLQNCKIPEGTNQLLYLPIRTDHFHYVGLVVDPVTKRTYYYDSLGKKCSGTVEEAIVIFCSNNKLELPTQYEESSNPHQTDRTHCALYQMRWYGHVCTQKSGPLDPKTLYNHQASTQKMLELRQALAKELEASITKPKVASTGTAAIAVGTSGITSITPRPLSSGPPIFASGLDTKDND